MIHRLYRLYCTGQGNYEIVVHEELRRMWKEVVMIYSKITVWHLPGKTKESNENPESG
jgi:hypothetical protein